MPEWPYQAHPMQTPERSLWASLAIYAGIFFGGVVAGSTLNQHLRPTTPPESLPALKDTDQLLGEEAAALSPTIYITRTGTKYHRATCQYAKTGTPATLDQARARGLTPCSRCKP